MSNVKIPVVNTTPALSLLGVAFVVLKLTGVIAWSWWAVLAPFYAPLALIALATFIIFTVAIILAFFKR